MSITTTGDRLEVIHDPTVDDRPQAVADTTDRPAEPGAGVAEVQASTRPTFTITDAATSCSVSRKTITRKLPELAGHGAAKDEDGVWRIPVEALLASRPAPRPVAARGRALCCPSGRADADPGRARGAGHRHDPARSLGRRADPPRPCRGRGCRAWARAGGCPPGPSRPDGGAGDGLTILRDSRPTRTTAHPQARLRRSLRRAQLPERLRSVRRGLPRSPTSPPRCRGKRPDSGSVVSAAVDHGGGQVS